MVKDFNAIFEKIDFGHRHLDCIKIEHPEWTFDTSIIEATSSDFYLEELPYDSIFSDTQCFSEMLMETFNEYLAECASDFYRKHKADFDKLENMQRRCFSELDDGK